jgi:uncharacterized protein YbjT (DUF2867 family)
MMKITVTGSIGNISKPLTAQLVKAGHEVKVISSNAANKAAIAELGAEALIGSIDDIDFLADAFKGADFIYTMVPNNFAASDYRAYIAEIGRNYASAIEKSSVKQVVNLSSIGADQTGGTGPIAGLHDVENTLNQLVDVNVRHVRAAYFFTNYYNDIPLIKHLNTIGANYGPDTKMLLVQPEDIADAIAHEIEQGFTGKSYRYVVGEDITAAQAGQVLGEAVGKPALQWTEFTDEQALDGMLQAGLPAEISRNYVEMGVALRTGLLRADYEKTNGQITGKRSLKDFGAQFAAKFNQA